MTLIDALIRAQNSLIRPLRRKLDPKIRVSIRTALKEVNRAYAMVNPMSKAVTEEARQWADSLMGDLSAEVEGDSDRMKSFWKEVVVAVQAELDKLA